MSKFTDSLSSVIRGGDSDDVLGYIISHKKWISPNFRIFNAKIKIIFEKVCERLSFIDLLLSDLVAKKLKFTEYICKSSY